MDKENDIVPDVDELVKEIRTRINAEPKLTSVHRYLVWGLVLTVLGGFIVTINYYSMNWGNISWLMSYITWGFMVFLCGLILLITWVFHRVKGNKKVPWIR